MGRGTNESDWPDLLGDIGNQSTKTGVVMAGRFEITDWEKINAELVRNPALYGSKVSCTVN
jgi:hypothetical protein